MRKILLLAAACAALLAMPAADAQPARGIVSCESGEVPSSLAGRVFLARGPYNDGLLRNESLATPDESAALKTWFDAQAGCRSARIIDINSISSAAASLRRALDARNAKVLDDLAARKISFGAANRQWSDAELDFTRLYANALAQRVPLNAAVPPVPATPDLSAADRALQQQLDMNAAAQKGYEDAMKARMDAARPGLCPSNPSGQPGLPPDPVTQPFC